MIYNELIQSEAGLITGPLFKVANRSALPEQLVQTSTIGKNLTPLGSRWKEIRAASIAFDEKQSIAGTIGEFCERYAPSFFNEEQFIYGSYTELSASGKNCLSPNEIALYSDQQYNSDHFPYKKLDEHHSLNWTEMRDLIQNKSVWVPAFLVYMPYFISRKEENYIMSTTTGLAAAENQMFAKMGGFLECAERHAFSQWWYKQLNVPKYSASFIQTQYPESKRVQILLNNPNVQMTFFDLADLSPVETIVTFMFFSYRGELFQSIGASSRFNKKDAIIKSALEAYQGVELAIMLSKQPGYIDNCESDFAQINDFDKHFAFYNKYPQFRECVPLIQQALQTGNSQDEFYNVPNKMKSLDVSELPKSGLKHLFYKNLTTADVADLGIHVSRVLTPEWALLTGDHNSPFFGSDVFKNRTDLFTEYPHPFP